jgi:hypothetical protein
MKAYIKPRCAIVLENDMVDAKCPPDKIKESLAEIRNGMAVEQPISVFMIQCDGKMFVVNGENLYYDIAAPAIIKAGGRA